MSAASTQADDDALLAAEAFSFGLHYPEIWKRYLDGRLSDIDRRISQRYPSSGGTDWGTGSGTGAGLGNPSFGNDPANASPAR